MWDTHYTTHTHTQLHTHTPVQTYTHPIHTTTHTQVHTQHTQLHTHTPTDTHTHNYTNTSNTQNYTHKRTYRQTHNYTHPYTDTYNYTHTNTHTQLHTNTHTLLFQRLFLSPTFWTFCYSISTRTDSEAEAPILRTPDAKSQLTGNDPDAGKDRRQEEKEVAEDEMVGWHHWLNGHEFRQTQEDSEVQGSLACRSSWGCKQLDTT